MFESTKQWFDSLEKQSKLFDNADAEVLHSALASVLYHIIIADDQVASREKQEFSTILKREFNLNDDQIEHLFLSAKSSSSELLSDLQTVNHYLKQTPLVRMNFMSKLIHLIDVGGVKDRELEIFYQTLHLVFPEVKEQ